MASDGGYTASALGRAHGGEKIDLRPLNIRAVDAEQRLSGMDVLAGPADEQILDEPVRSHGDDGQAGFVVHDRADGADRTHDHARVDRFGAHAAALDLVEADLDGLAVVLLLAFVDRDVVHPHPVLLRDRRGVGQAHGIAVVQNLARAARRCRRLLPAGLERDFLVLEHRKIVAAVRRPSSARPTNTGAPLGSR